MLTTFVALATALPRPAAQEKPSSAAPPAAPAPAPAVLEQRLEDLGLTLGFPAELAIRAQKLTPAGQVRASWTGQLGASKLVLRLSLIGRQEFGLLEPSEVLELVAESLTDTDQGGDPAFHFDERAFVDGPFGWASYACFARGRKHARGERPESQVFYLGGLLEDAGYALEVDAQPPLADAEAAVVKAFLTQGLVHDGPQRDPKWTDAEAEQRWRESVPASKETELEDVLRTPHYIILTNSSGGKTFAKKMEECHAAIRKVYPFEEVPGRRLLPVFLFRTNDQYYAFFAQAFDSTVEQARRSGGVASGDFYATWYEAPGDPVHVHEATHQIFRNRLGLGGGGSWFQEGVAEYMSTKDNERGSAARAVTKGRHVPLAQFVRVPSLLFSPDAEDKLGKDEAGSQYEQAALLIEFLRESKFGKQRFQDFLHAVGVAQRNNLLAIEAAVRRVYGVDLAGLEQQFVEYCKKR